MVPLRSSASWWHNCDRCRVAPNLTHNHRLRRVTSSMRRGSETDVGLHLAPSAADTSRVSRNVGLIHKGARLVAIGIVIGLTCCTLRTIAQHTNDEVVYTIVVKGGVECYRMPARGEGLGFIAVIHLGEVRHGNPLRGRCRTFISVAHVDGNRRRIERGRNSLRLYSQLSDIGSRGKTYLRGKVNGLCPCGGSRVAKRGNRTGASTITDGYHLGRLGRGAEGAENQCGREGQEPRGGFQGVLFVFHIVYVFVSKRINAPRSGENKMQRYTFLSAWQRQFKLNILKKGGKRVGER